MQDISECRGFCPQPSNSPATPAGCATIYLETESFPQVKGSDPQEFLPLQKPIPNPNF